MADNVIPTVFAVAIVLLAMPAAAHDLYSGLKSPLGRDCCGNNHCRHVEVFLNPETGELEIELAGKRWAATNPSWYIGPSPDGSWHGCQWPSQPLPVCVMGGAGT